jgi:hypothetical protein
MAFDADGIKFSFLLLRLASLAVSRRSGVGEGKRLRSNGLRTVYLRFLVWHSWYSRHYERVCAGFNTRCKFVLFLGVALGIFECPFLDEVCR